MAIEFNSGFEVVHRRWLICSLCHSTFVDHTKTLDAPPSPCPYVDKHTVKPVTR